MSNITALVRILVEANMRGDIFGDLNDRDIEDILHGEKRKPSPKVLARVNRQLEIAKKEFAKLPERFYRGQLNASSLGNLMAKYLIDLYDDLYRAGIEASGVPKSEIGSAVTKKDVKHLKDLVREELGYLKNLVTDITLGKIGLATSNKRAANYIDTARSTFGSVFVQRSNPNTLYYWDEEPDACRECRILAANGPYTKENLPTLPKAGHSRCRQNCRCRVRAVPSSAARVAAVDRRSKTRQQLRSLLIRSMKVKVRKSKARSGR